MQLQEKGWKAKRDDVEAISPFVNIFRIPKTPDYDVIMRLSVGEFYDLRGYYLWHALKYSSRVFLEDFGGIQQVARGF